jgi:hypothetical protein
MLATLALALGVDEAPDPLVGLTLAPDVRVGVGVGSVCVWVGDGVTVDVDVGSVTGDGGVVAAGTAVADGAGQGVARPRPGDGEGANAVRLGPTGLITCWAGPGDGVVSLPIPITAPITAAARQTLPPAAIARRRQRSRRPRLTIPVMSAGPVLPANG